MLYAASGEELNTKLIKQAAECSTSTIWVQLNVRGIPDPIFNFFKISSQVDRSGYAESFDPTLSAIGPYHLFLILGRADLPKPQRVLTPSK